ncbi:DUF3817 domain-containing protein [Reichenbachiella versicolor]|uniref:DUF3817 domain-containing protein n=1 Tax=Reichenbachiella versicolor TaxID=1821036 RepID=UPI000D6E86F1|nr:DUF3817 domain-containing protein [Reichenbachiella versicolor]
MNFKTPIGRLRIMAIAEGISYLLFGVTMPMKYLLDIPEPNYVVGMAHGWFFILYIYLCFQNALLHHWRKRDLAIGLVASLIPFGTFYADQKIFKPTEIN